MPEIRTVHRYDFRKIQKAKKTDNGFLIAPVRATRSGVFTYRTNDGSVIKEYRPEAEVFAKESMDSLAFVPVTNRHPKHGLVTTATAKKDAVGSVGEIIEKDQNFISASLVIFDQETINDIENNGIQEVSCGYTADLEFSPGTTPEGEHYDAIQKNIRYNHIATVKRGRAGNQVRLKLDAQSAILDDGEVKIDDLYTDEKNPKYDKPKEGIMPKMKLNGAEFDVEAGLAGAIKAELDAAKKSAKKDAADEFASEKADLEKDHKAKMDGLQAKLDTATEKVEELEKSKLDDKEITERVKARAKLVDAASKLVSKETNLDEMTDLEIKKEVVKQNTKCDESKLDSEEYVQARFDGVLETAKPADPKNDPFRETMKTKTDGEGGDPKVKTAAQLRADKMEADQNAYLKPIGFSLAK